MLGWPPALLASSLPAAKLLGLSEPRGLSVEHSDIPFILP